MAAAAIVFARGAYYVVSDEYRAVQAFRVESIQTLLLAIAMLLFAIALRLR